MLVSLGLQVTVVCAGLFLKSDLNSAGGKKASIDLARGGDSMYPFDFFLL